MWFQRDKEQSIMSKLDRHEVEIADLKSHKTFCDSQHAEHNRRREDALKVQNSTDLTLKAILNKIEEFTTYVPAMKKSTARDITFDTLRGWASFAAAIAAGVTPVFLVYHYFMGG